MAALCFLLLSGCRKTDAQKTPAIPAATEQAKKHGEFRDPDYSGLIEEYRTLLAQNPNNPAAIIALGNAYFDSGNWKKAITMYEHALLIDPRNADVRTDMAAAYRNTGMTDRALSEYRIALKHEPAHLNARYNLGLVFAYDKKDYTAAIRVWEELLRLSPNYPRAEDMKSGIAVFRKALKKGTT